MLTTGWQALWLTLIASTALLAQPAQSALESDRAAVDGERILKAAAVNKVVDAFNRIGMHGAELRKTMSPDEAIAFDAIMIDVMAALATIPGISLKNWDNPETIKPQRPKPERLSQLAPNLAGLDKFFARLLAASRNSADRAVLTSAQKSLGQMIAALPDVLPIVSAPPRRP